MTPLFGGRGSGRAVLRGACLRGVGLAALVLCALALAGPVDAADELCLTGNARGGRNLRVDYTVQPESAKPLFDGSHLDRLSAGMQNTQVVVTFAEPVRVTRVTVVCYNDPPRTYNAAQRARAIASLKGAAVEGSPWVSLADDAVLLCGTDDHLVLGAESQAALAGKAPADTVTVAIEKKPGAYQCLIREITVWGIPERLAAASKGPGTPLDFQASECTYSSIGVRWDKLPAGAAYVRVRCRAQGGSAWETTSFTESPGIVRWVRPGTAYEVDAQAVGGPGSSRKPKRAQVRLPAPLEIRTIGDSLGMNFYPGGGGAHQAQPDETANTRRMIALMRDAGVRHVRWWVPSPGGAEMFGDAGMSLLPSATFTDPAGYERLARTTGVWLTATTNEPDFADVFAPDFARQFQPRCAAARRFSPLMLVCGPAVGGELAGPGADYLADGYAAGLKDAVDVLDLHPYGKTSTPLSRGGHLGGPEGLLESMAGCRAAMRAAGDAGRPVMATESGHPTYEGEWFMPASSYERQAQWIVRTHLLLLASGVRRLFWYALQDEGTDKRNAEHCFGIVDWHGQPKPACRSYRAFTRLLSKARLEGLERGLKPPVYAVRCAEGGRFITAMWDSGGESEVCLPAGAPITSMVSLFGEALPVPGPVGGARVLKVDESVRYVLSKRPLTFLSQRRLSPPLEPMVRMELAPTTVRARPGETCRWTARLSSEFDCPVRVLLDTANPWGGKRPEGEVLLTPRGSAEVPMEAAAPADAKTRIISWDVRCRVQPQDTRRHPVEFRRALFFLVSPAGGAR